MPSLVPEVKGIERLPPSRELRSAFRSRVSSHELDFQNAVFDDSGNVDSIESIERLNGGIGREDVRYLDMAERARGVPKLDQRRMLSVGRSLKRPGASPPDSMGG